MNLTALALKRDRVAGVALLVVAILGLSVYGGMPRDSMPPFTVRTANIVTACPGASPARVEELATRELEKQARSLPEVETISSESRTGLSIVTVRLYETVDPAVMQDVWDRLRRTLSDGRDVLPDGCGDPVLKDDEVGLTYGLVVGLVSDGFGYAEMERYAERVEDVLVKLPHVSQVELAGVQSERVYIEFDEARLKEFGLSAAALSERLASINILYSGGSLPLGDERIVLEPTGELRTVEQLAETLIPLGAGVSRPLRDLARVHSEYVSPRTSMVRVNGMPAITLHVSLRAGANIIALGEQVDEAVSRLEASLPLGLSLVRVASQDRVVDEAVGDFVSNLLQSVGVVLLVMFVFLGLRTGVVVASLIPMTLLMALVLMHAAGTGLNKVSLAALIMALGMLVDNAIVMAEATMVRMERGTPVRTAAIESSAELAAPLLISTLTTTAAFLPFYLAESRMGDMIGPLFLVIAFALLSSWLMALVIVPLLAVPLLRVAAGGSRRGGLIGLLRPAYDRLVDLSLRHRGLVVMIVVVAFVVAVGSFRFIPYVFFPPSDRPLVTVDVRLPAGGAIEQTDRTVARIESFIREELLVGEGRPEGVVDWSAFIGAGPPSYDLGYRPGESRPFYAHMLLNTSSDAANGPVIQRLDRFCFKRLPEASVIVSRLASSGNAGAPIEVRLFGERADVLFALKSTVHAKLASLPGAKSVGDSWGPRIKKLVIDVDPSRVQRAGLSNRDVASSLRTSLSGLTAGTLRADAGSVPIVIRSDSGGAYQIEQLQGAVIHSQAGEASAPLGQVADVSVDWQFSSIRRYDLERALTVTAYARGKANVAAIVAELEPWLAEESQSWPPGYTFSLGGERERGSRGLSSVSEEVPLAGFLILILLVLNFNSIRKTAIVLTTIPLGLIGVAFGLLVFNSFLSFFGILGVIALSGIVLNNAIVLLDRIRIEQESGLAPGAALRRAAGERFRPILLTTFTTTLGLIPLYLGGGKLWEPMAIALMVGLLFATLITLVFVPVLYSLLFRLGSATDPSTSERSA